MLWMLCCPCCAEDQVEGAYSDQNELLGRLEAEAAEVGPFLVCLNLQYA